MKQDDEVFYSLETIINRTVFKTVILIHSLSLCRTEEILPIEDVSSNEPLASILCTSERPSETLWYKDVACVQTVTVSCLSKSLPVMTRPAPNSMKVSPHACRGTSSPAHRGSACTCLGRLSQEFLRLMHSVQCAPQY